MITATRILTLRDANRDIAIPINVHTPEQKAALNWICRCEIGWPEGTAERWGAGVDAIQAQLIALQMIGAEIYASRHHESGLLSWLEPGQGYGFPVSHNIRDLLIGDDAKFF